MTSNDVNAAPKRIFLSPPHMAGDEQAYIRGVFESNWIAPTGPDVSQFESEFATEVGARYATATSSGTAALHLALRAVGVGENDEVFCSTLTFIASATPIIYLGAKPVFVDSDEQTWNMDPHLLRIALEERARKNRLPKAIVLAHIFGQSADVEPILDLCQNYNIPLIEDAAEALGAKYKGETPGTFGQAGIYSFNGNKIITTSGGGMLVSNNASLIDKARFWSTQAREPLPHYEHQELGYNYRMSNVLAAIGRGQLCVLHKRVSRKREIFEYYKTNLEHLPGISFMPEAAYGMCSRWLTCITVDPQKAGIDREHIRNTLERNNIESRPVWKPMHLQPLFKENEVIGGKVSEDLFSRGLCLPSGTALQTEDLARIVKIICGCWE